MNSSDDELPEIPGTRFPWMNLEETSQEEDAEGCARPKNQNKR